jgi:molybdate transport system regulatory protein
VSKTPSIRFRIDFAENSHIGPGKIALLEAIGSCGSLSEAARGMNLSYRRAWLLLDSLNNCFDKPVSINSVGGARGGGVVITDFGLSLIRCYRELESEISVIAEKHLGDILPKPLRRRAAAAKPAVRRKSLTKSRRRS